MKKLRLMLFTIIALTLALHTAPAVSALPQADTEEEYSIAYINDYQGECELVKKGGGEPEPVQDIYIPLYEGDSVTTGEIGSMEIVFDDATIINLDENSRLTIQSLNRGNGNKTIIDLIKGSLTAIVKKLAAGDEFKVKTNMAMAAVKGTEFSVEAGDDHKVGVFDGSVEVSGLDRSGKITGHIMVNKGSETVIDRTMRRPGQPRHFSPGMIKRAGGVRTLRQKITNLRDLRRAGGIRKFKLDRRLERIKYLKGTLKNHVNYRTMPEKRRAAANRVIMQEQRLRQQRDAIDKKEKYNEDSRQELKKKKRWF